MSGVDVSSRGAVAVVFASYHSGGGAVNAFVRPAGAARFGPLQVLVGDEEYGGSTGVSTLGGEIVIADVANGVTTFSTLGPRARRFASTNPGAVTDGPAAVPVSDDAGGVLLAATPSPGGRSCRPVRPHGS